jgi:hypothetical protein
MDAAQASGEWRPYNLPKLPLAILEQAAAAQGQEAGAGIVTVL